MAALRKVRLVADTCPKKRKGKDCNRCKYFGVRGGNKITCYYYDMNKNNEESK